MENDPLAPTEAVESSELQPGATHMDFIRPDETLSIDDLPDANAKPPRIKDLLLSPDYPSRFVTLLSIIFTTLACLCISILTYVIISHHRGKSNNDLDSDHQKVYLEPTISEQLGTFQVVLKAEASQTHDFDLRVDIVAECSTQEACDSLKKKLVDARDLINPILSSVTRQEFLTLDGKNRIRRRIAEQLSGIVQEGKIEEIQFTNMTVETGK